MEAAARPLPSEESTPPVTKINFVFIAVTPHKDKGLGGPWEGAFQAATICSVAYVTTPPIYLTFSRIQKREG
jgi:hypothetical protein